MAIMQYLVANGLPDTSGLRYQIGIDVVQTSRFKAMHHMHCSCRAGSKSRWSRAGARYLQSGGLSCMERSRCENTLISVCTVLTSRLTPNPKPQQFENHTERAPRQLYRADEGRIARLCNSRKQQASNPSRREKCFFRVARPAVWPGPKLSGSTCLADIQTMLVHVAHSLSQPERAELVIGLEYCPIGQVGPALQSL